MKSKYLTKLSITLLTVLITGCNQKWEDFIKEGDNYYNNGVYDSAVYNSVEALKLNSKYDKANNLLKISFPAAINKHLRLIEEYKSSDKKFKWDIISREYEELVKLNKSLDSIYSILSTEDKEKLITTDYSTYLNIAKNNAAEGHYSEGLTLAKNPDRLSQKKSAEEFKIASSFVEDYKDALQLYEKSRKYAIKKIAIIPFENNSGKGNQYGSVSEMLTDEITSKIFNDSAMNEFLTIVTRDKINQLIKEYSLANYDSGAITKLGKLLEADEIIVGRITQISYNLSGPFVIKKQEKSSDTIKQQYVEEGITKERDVKREFFANLEQYNVTAKANVSGSYQVIDIKTAQVKSTQTFTENSTFSDEWASFVGGDDKAISFETQRLLNKKPGAIPDGDELIRESVFKIANSIKSYIKENSINK